MKFIFLTLILLVIVSCKGGGDESSSSSSNAKIEYLFSDNSVTNFEQTSGLAKNKNIIHDIFNFAFPTAIAVSANISCIQDSIIDLTATALSTTISFPVSCNHLMESQIRSNLLGVLDGYALKRTVTDAFYKNGAMDMRLGSGGFNWEIPYSVKAMEDGNEDGTTGDACYDKYAFHRDSGTVTIAFDPIASHANCYCSSHPDECQPSNVAFRFYNGTLEMDLSGDGIYDQTRGRHANTDEICNDAGTDPNCESFYERWESCTVGVNCTL